MKAKEFTPVVSGDVAPLKDTLGAGEALGEAVGHLENPVAGPHRVVRPAPVRQPALKDQPM